MTKRFPLQTFASRAAWRTWERLPKELRPRWVPRVTGRLTDQFWSRWILPCRVFHSLWGFHLASWQAAKRQGAVTLLENPGRHARRWLEADLEEPLRFGVSPRERGLPWTAWALPQVEREYAFCDCIAVPSASAHRSFAELGLENKTVVIAPGVDTDFFTPPPRPERRLFRACFVGRIELTKGVGYLLQAWNRLALPDAELVLVGAIKSDMKELLRTHANSTVQTAGVLPPSEVAQRYREADLFVFPSVNEGFAQVLLEAMAAGLPVVASDLSGAIDCITDGKEGIIVPARDVDRLAEAVLWCYQHRDESRAMGVAARERVESQFTLGHYNQRVIALYRKLAGRR